MEFALLRHVSPVDVDPDSRRLWHDYGDAMLVRLYEFGRAVEFVPVCEGAHLDPQVSSPRAVLDKLLGPHDSMPTHVTLERLPVTHIDVLITRSKAVPTIALGATPGSATPISFGMPAFASAIGLDRQPNSHLIWVDLSIRLWRIARSALGSLCVALLATAALPGASAAPRPNIIFILADDLGYSDIGVYASRYYETPNIDLLAAQGLKLTNHHHSPNCAPTHAALMSGQYGARTGVYTVGPISRFDWSARPLRPVENVEKLPLDRATVAGSLKDAGYATAMFGKWHLGDDGDHHPGRRGFDEAIVSMGLHFEFDTNPKTGYPKGQYLADFLTDRAVDFIHRRKDGPFFLFLSHFGVHAPHQAKPELVERFRQKPGIGGHANPTYAAMIASVDESVGRVMRVLDELGLAHNTLLIFASDNGGVGGYLREGLRNAAGDITDNAPLRSGKGSLYEGGTRVPFIARWPGVTSPGRVSDTPSAHVDLYPTFLEIARASRPAQVLDGESLVNLFRGADSRLKDRAIFEHFPGYLGAGSGTWRTTPVSVIQAGDWKLMEFLEDGRQELYNLRQDLGETRNLAASLPGKTRELQRRLVAWRKAVKAPMPARNTVTAKPAS